MRVRRARWRRIFKTQRERERERQKKSGARRGDAAAELCLCVIQIQEKVASGSGTQGRRGQGGQKSACDGVRCCRMGLLVSSLCQEREMISFNYFPFSSLKMYLLHFFLL
jgi:hypothetical protein